MRDTSTYDTLAVSKGVDLEDSRWIFIDQARMAPCGNR